MKALTDGKWTYFLMNHHKQANEAVFRDTLTTPFPIWSCEVTFEPFEGLAGPLGPGRLI